LRKLAARKEAAIRIKEEDVKAQASISQESALRVMKEEADTEAKAEAEERAVGLAQAE
jgi:hypothetical protein